MLDEGGLDDFNNSEKYALIDKVIEWKNAEYGDGDNGNDVDDEGNATVNDNGNDVVDTMPDFPIPEGPSAC